MWSRGIWHQDLETICFEVTGNVAIGTLKFQSRSRWKETVSAAQCYIFITLLVHTFVFKVICLTVSLEMILNNEILRFPRALSNRKGWQVREETTLLTSATADRQNILVISKVYNLPMKSPRTIWRRACVPKAVPSCCAPVQENTYFMLLYMVQKGSLNLCLQDDLRNRYCTLKGARRQPLPLLMWGVAVNLPGAL